MRHVVADGDTAAIFDRAITLLLEDIAPRAGHESVLRSHN